MTLYTKCSGKNDLKTYRYMLMKEERRRIGTTPHGKKLR